MVTSGIIVARRLRRKKKITSATRIDRFDDRLEHRLIDCSMNTEES